MKIVIAGANPIGRYLADVLSSENQDVIVVDSNREELASIDAGCNVLTSLAEPTSASMMRSVIDGGCASFISVLDSDMENIVACSLAKKLGAGSTLAQANASHFLEEASQEFLRSIGVDNIINYPRLLAREIELNLMHPWARQWLELHGGDLVVAAIKIRPGAPIGGMMLRDMAASIRNFHILVIVRAGESFIPRGDDSLLVGDVLYFAAVREKLEVLVELTGNSTGRIRRAMIMGAGSVAESLVRARSRSLCDYKLIEMDEVRCEEAVSTFADCEVIHGDARRTEILEYAGRADAFIALTNSDEVNIMACAGAMRNGIPHTIAKIKHLRNFGLVEQFGVSCYVNRRMAIGNFIFSTLLASERGMTGGMALPGAQIFETEASADSRLVGRPVKDLRLPKEMTLAGIVRNGVSSLVNGSTVIEPGDGVLVVCKRGHIIKSKKLFS